MLTIQVSAHTEPAPQESGLALNFRLAFGAGQPLTRPHSAAPPVRAVPARPATTSHTTGRVMAVQGPKFLQLVAIGLPEPKKGLAAVD